MENLMGTSLQLEHFDTMMVTAVMCTLLITRLYLYSLYMLQLPTLHSSISHLTLSYYSRVSWDSHPSSFADSTLYPIEEYIVKGVQYPPKMAQQEHYYIPIPIASGPPSTQTKLNCVLCIILCVYRIANSKFLRGSLFAFLQMIA